LPQSCNPLDAGDKMKEDVPRNFLNTAVNSRKSRSKLYKIEVYNLEKKRSARAKTGRAETVVKAKDGRVWRVGLMQESSRAASDIARNSRFSSGMPFRLVCV
jgi:hypothetical protein